MPTSKFNKLASARVLVLGGTSGIGFAVAEGAIEYGASVVVASSNAARVEKAQERLRAAYPDRASAVSGQTCDLQDAANVEANITALLKFATKDGKKIDHIITTAGGPGDAPALSELTLEKLHAPDHRTTSVMLLAKLAPAYMEPGPQSSITVTTGTLLFKPTAAYATVMAPFGAVDALVRGLALALAPVRVNAVAPGTIDTELLQSAGTDDSREAIYDYFRGTTILKAIGRPEDTAEAYLYITKDRYITGQTVLTDGGRMLA